MKKVNRIILGITCAFMLLSVGCVKLWQENLEMKTYVIEAPRNRPPLETPLADKLWIDSVVVLPPYNIRNLIQRKNDVEFSTSYYSELLMAPRENFKNVFYTWFAESGLFADVTLENRMAMTHRLAITVMEFYGDTPQQKAVLKIKVTLFDEKTSGMRVLFSNDYSQAVDFADTTAEELIRAYNKALVKILSDCEQDVVSSLN